jgi:hypothetical protein
MVSDPIDLYLFVNSLHKIGKKSMGGASDKIQGKVWVFLKNPSHLELVCGDGDNARMLTSPQWCVATIGVRIWWEFAFDLRILLIFVKS